MVSTIVDNLSKTLTLIQTLNLTLMLNTNLIPNPNGNQSLNATR